MKVRKLFVVRCNPTITWNKLESLKGMGTAYITESLSPKRIGFNIRDNFIEIKDSELKEAALEGRDIVYRTASLGGSHKIFARKK